MEAQGDGRGAGRNMAGEEERRTAGAGSRPAPATLLAVSLLHCASCGATARNTSKERRQFLRRHPALCQPFNARRRIANIPSVRTISQYDDDDDDESWIGGD
jgi:hypothetical protein